MICSRPRAVARSQKGAAALALTCLLCFAALLGVVYAQRNLLSETRAAAQAVRATQAAQATESGLEWAVAMLNDSRPRDDDCVATPAASGLSFRERMLVVDAASGTLAPVTWNDGGVARVAQAACRVSAAEWHCSCPRAAAPSLGDAGGGHSFVVEFAAGPRPGLLRGTVLACTRQDAACSAAATGAGFDAAARAEALFAFRPALRAAPAAAVTARGNVDSSTAFAVGNPDPSMGGLAIQAGGRVLTPQLRVETFGGQPLAGAIAAADPALAGLSTDRYFARYFGAGPEAWSAQPGATVVACASDCAGALADAARRGGRLLVLPQASTIDAPLSLGSPSAPVIVVARGPLRIAAELTLYGVLAADSLTWTATSGSVDGALIVTGSVTVSGAPRWRRDAAVLAALARQGGSFVRVNGSWKDF